MRNMKKAAAAIALASALAFVAPAALATVGGSVTATPSSIASGQSVTLVVTVTNIPSSSDAALSSLEVCPGGSVSGCGALTGYSISGTIPTISCTTGACEGTWTVQYPSGSTIACAVTSGTGSCSSSSGSISWTSGATTSTMGSYGVVGTICSPAATCTPNVTQFSVDTSFSTPEFGAIGVVLVASLIGVLMLRKKVTISAKAQAAGAN